MKLDAGLLQDTQIDTTDQSNVLSLDLLSNDSVDSNAPCCRICRTSEDSQETGELIRSPCSCRGSLGFVHKLCMETWLSRSGQETCELCHFKFVTERRLIPLRKWNIGEILESLANDEKGFLLLGIVSLILILLEIPFLYFVIKLNYKYFSRVEDDTATYKESESEVYPLLLLVLLAFTLLLVAMSVVFLVFGFKVFKKVISYNREIFLILPMRSLQGSTGSEEVV